VSCYGYFSVTHCKLFITKIQIFRTLSF
jgi:hypothetical protein